MRRLLPSPTLSICLFAIWLILCQSLEPSTLLMAFAMSLIIPLLTKKLRPSSSRPDVAVHLAIDVLSDMITSAMNVAKLICLPKKINFNNHFVSVPLRLKDPNGLATLSLILCITPGTAWAKISQDCKTLTVHVFDLKDKDLFIAKIQQRYENPLLAIFQPISTPS